MNVVCIAFDRFLSIKEPYAYRYIDGSMFQLNDCKSKTNKAQRFDWHFHTMVRRFWTHVFGDAISDQFRVQDKIEDKLTSF